MTLTLVRHTKVGIPTSICYGQTDAPLAETYPEEWAEAVRKLGGDLGRFSKIYSSPLQRCLLFAKRYFGEVETDPRLMEINFGEWEGKPWEEIFALPEGKAWFADYLHATPPGGESYPEMAARVRSFYEEKVKGKEGDLLLVTHSGVFRCLLEILKGYTPEEAMAADIGYGDVLTFEL